MEKEINSTLEIILNHKNPCTGSKVMINLLKVALTPGAPEELREEREIEPLSLSHIE